MIEGIEGLKNIDRRWENTICVVAGSCGDAPRLRWLMWSQSVIVEVYSLRFCR